MSSSSEYNLREGDAAYFMHLHLHTVVIRGKHQYREGHWVLELEGKPRPMLIVRCLPKKERGRSWYVAVPITTKGLDEAGQLRKNHERIGNCLESSKESFILLEPQKYPDNLLHCHEPGAPKLTPCDPIGFANAVKIVSHRLLHAPRLPESNEDVNDVTGREPRAIKLD